MVFNKTSHDFGTLEEGEKRTEIFTFKNTSDKELKIEFVSGSCGCTVPELSKNKFAPGESGEIVVNYDSKGKEAAQDIDVTVILDHTDENDYPIIKIITLKAFVNKK